MDIVERLRQITVGTSITQAAVVEIETLRARVAELEQERDNALQSYLATQTVYAKQLAAVTKERDELEKDAARYQYLRNIDRRKCNNLQQSPKSGIGTQRRSCSIWVAVFENTGEQHAKN